MRPKISVSREKTEEQKDLEKKKEEEGGREGEKRGGKGKEEKEGHPEFIVLLIQ